MLGRLGGWVGPCAAWAAESNRPHRRCSVPLQYTPAVPESLVPNVR